MTRSLMLAGVVLVLGLAGCAGPAHMSEDHGKSYAAAFPRPEKGAKVQPRGPVSGLDSQEAAIVAQTYRRSLAGKAQQPKEQPILILGTPPETGGYNLPPPSVPKER